MRKKISRWLYYKFTRLSIKAKWSRNKLPELTKIQKYTMDITLTLMADNDSELMINPSIDERVGEKYYVKKNKENGEVEKFITITKTSMGYSIAVMGHEYIEETKHSYHLDIWFNDVCGRMIVDKFTRILRRRRNKMENEIRKDDEKTLELILKKLKND